MESVLKTIAVQANLDRILFTPGLKKIYFDMAVGSGGASQFKHADSVRSGLSYVADKAGDKKRALLFCLATELVHGFDALLQAAAELKPIAILVLREPVAGAPENWNDLMLRDSGWIQFLTHTRQELYDHLALAFHGFEEEKINVPVMLLHSALKHESAGDWEKREDINLGNPLTGLQSARAGKTIDFEAALAAVKKKKDPPTMRNTYPKIVPALRGIYENFGYSLPDAGLPFFGSVTARDAALVTLVAANDEKNALDDPSFDYVRPLAYRPAALDGLLDALREKKTIAVLEHEPPPGAGAPPFFSEVCAALCGSFSGRVVSITVPNRTACLKEEELDAVRKTVDQLDSDAGRRFYSLSL